LGLSRCGCGERERCECNWGDSDRACDRADAERSCTTGDEAPPPAVLTRDAGDSGDVRVERFGCSGGEVERARVLKGMRSERDAAGCGGGEPLPTAERMDRGGGEAGSGEREAQARMEEEGEAVASGREICNG